MKEKLFFTSLTRIADLRDRPFEVRAIPRERWANGDYVVARVDHLPRGYQTVELESGRMAEVGPGASVVGALGVRHATLEAVGSWAAVTDDLRLQCLTSAGLLGRVTSLSSALQPLLDLRYVGHVTRAERSLGMTDFVEMFDERSYTIPTVLLVGTSMSAGKTTAGKAIIRCLKEAGLRVVGAKVSGAGRYRDVLGMSDAGADEIVDFVDVGLASSILAADAFRPRLRQLMARIMRHQPDVVVAEAGASPLEPYNGGLVMEELGPQVRFTVLCASDPYAVVGVMRAFGDLVPDLVGGLATSTLAGIELVEKLTGIPALNVLDPAAQPLLARLLAEKLVQRGGNCGPYR